MMGKKEADKPKVVKPMTAVEAHQIALMIEKQTGHTISTCRRALDGSIFIIETFDHPCD